MVAFIYYIKYVEKTFDFYYFLSIGTYYFANKDVYAGEWINNERTGNGIYYWQNKDRYEGEFFKGELHGKGTYYWHNGDTYEGSWYLKPFSISLSELGSDQMDPKSLIKKNSCKITRHVRYSHYIL
jgi:hypothetical protein